MKAPTTSSLTPYLALAALVAVSSANSLVLRQSRASHAGSSKSYSVWQAICASELLKVAFAGIGMVVEARREAISLTLPTTTGEVGPKARGIIRTVFCKADMLALTIPTLLYLIQNALNFQAISLLPAVVFQTVNQTKILTTAIFTIVMLNRYPSRQQWLALFLLALGVVIAEYHGSLASTAGSWALGILAASSAATLSGFVGVYLEKFLKSSNNVSIWARNAQMGIFSAAVGFVFGVLIMDGQQAERMGPLQNFDGWTWTAVFLQAASGIIIAAVLKYAGTILKNFAASLSIVLTGLLSALHHDFELDLSFVIGTLVIFLATWVYTRPQPKLKQDPSAVFTSSASVRALIAKTASAAPDFEHEEEDSSFAVSKDKPIRP
ncbi:hypothetical protein HKX48_000949 [Thoreauomyces humboldtii]|nr:hypothetical protein HKX48_000949 [Thoreauomyces humboldtii]